MVSTGTVTDTIPKWIEAWNPRRIFCAYDTTRNGNRAARRLQDMDTRIVRMRPAIDDQDWNDMLMRDRDGEPIETDDRPTERLNDRPTSSDAARKPHKPAVPRQQINALPNRRLTLALHHTPIAVLLAVLEASFAAHEHGVRCFASTIKGGRSALHALLESQSPEIRHFRAEKSSN